MKRQTIQFSGGSQWKYSSFILVKQIRQTLDSITYMLDSTRIFCFIELERSLAPCRQVINLMLRKKSDTLTIETTVTIEHRGLSLNLLSFNNS